MEQYKCELCQQCENCPSRHNSVFSRLPDVNLDELSNNKMCNVYEKGQIIFYEGNRPLGLYCISNGKAIVIKSGLDGRKQIVRFAKEGDIIGYRALISGGNYTASASLLEDSSICFIHRDIFFKLLRQNYNLSLKIMCHLANDLKNAETKLTEMAQKPVRERTAEVLLLLTDFYGLKEDGKTINVSLKREDIANIVGTVTETLIRYLSEFRHEKIIDLDGREIQILNHKKLLRTANNFD